MLPLAMEGTRGQTLTKFNDTPKKDPAEITQWDFFNALKDIAEVNPDLIEYIITYYPPEKIVHIASASLCQRLEQQEKLLYLQGNTGS